MTTNLEHAAKRGSLLAATALARKAGLPAGAIAAITSAAGGTRSKRHAGAALLAESIGLSSAKKKKTAKKKAKPPVKDDPIYERDPDDDRDDDDSEDEARATASRGNVRRRIALLEQTAARRGPDRIGGLLGRSLEALGQPTSLRGLERAERDALVARDVTELRDNSTRSKADERRALDRVAQMSGYANHAALQKAARDARAVLKVI